MKSRRLHPRVRARLPATCERDGEPPFDVVITDISIAGCGIECTEAPAFGSPLTVVVCLHGAAKLSRLPAVVRWTRPGGFGVQFGSVGVRDTRSIALLMAGQSRRSVPPSRP
jgi:type IV pilus assembly protein PilZ